MDDWVIVCDFDGTITESDVSEEILKELAVGDWKAVEHLADAGVISMDQCITEQFEMLPPNLDKWFEIAERVSVREGFDEFIEKVTKNGFEFLCVSAGLKPVIDYYKKKKNWEFKVIAPEIIINQKGVKVNPSPYTGEYNDFKEHHVRELQKKGKRIIYIGDGGSDANAISYADRRLVIKGSFLEDHLQKTGHRFRTFETFSGILDLLKAIT